MLPLWQRIIYFHLQPAILDGMLSLAGVLLLLRIFRIRDPSIRSFFLFIPLVRPLIILLEGSAKINRVNLPNVYLALRFPDPFNIIPLHELVGENDFSSISTLIAAFILAAIIAALAILAFRWVGFIVFYRSIRRQSSSIHVNAETEQNLRSLVLDLSSKMGLERPPDIIFSESRWMTPCAIGCRRPALIIDPSISLDLEADELRAVLAHELSHIRRHDGLWHWISVLLRDIQSFSPFSHMSISRLSLEREKACDHEAVEALRLPPSLMARCLVKTSRLMTIKQSQPLPGYGLSFIKGQYGLLEKRLHYLLDMEEDGSEGRKPWKPSPGKFMKSVLLVAWLPLVSVQLCLCAWIGQYILMIK
jgi:Zn-dependent protease with chaperone function